MDVWAVVGVLVRRWYVLIPLLLVTVVASAAAYALGPRSYMSQASLVLTTPPTGGTEYANGYVPEPRNPLLLQDQAVSLAAAVLVQAMRTPQFADRLGLSEATTTHLTVANSPDGSYQVIDGPFVQLIVESASPDQARAVLQRATAEARDELRRRQAALQVPVRTDITLDEVLPPTSPVDQRRAGVRTAAVVLGIGFILSMLGVFVAESLLVRRGVGSALAFENQGLGEGHPLVRDPVQPQ